MLMQICSWQMLNTCQHALGQFSAIPQVSQVSASIHIVRVWYMQAFTMEMISTCEHLQDKSSVNAIIYKVNAT